MRGAGLIEDVLASGLALAGGAKAVGELLAVVGQHGVNDERCLGVQAFQAAGDGGGGLVGLDLEIDPAAGPVDGGDQIAMFGLVGYPGQVLHVHVHKARFVILERIRQRGFAFRLRQQVRQPSHAWRRRHRSSAERDSAGQTNSRATTSKSSSGNNRSLRNSTTTNSCSGFRVVAGWCGVCGRSRTVSRARQRRTVVSLTPISTASSAAGRDERWM